MFRHLQDHFDHLGKMLRQVHLRTELVPDRARLRWEQSLLELLIAESVPVNHFLVVEIGLPEPLHVLAAQAESPAWQVWQHRAYLLEAVQHPVHDRAVTLQRIGILIPQEKDELHEGGSTIISPG